MFRFSYLTTFALALLVPALIAQCPTFPVTAPFQTLETAGATNAGSMLFLPNGCLVANNDSNLCVYTFDPDTCSFTTTPSQYFTNTGTNGLELYNTLAFAPCGLLLAVDGVNNAIATYTVSGCTLTPSVSFRLPNREETVLSVAVSPDGSCAAITTYTSVYVIPISTSSCALGTSTSVSLQNGYAGGSVGFISDSCFMVTSETPFLISVQPNNCSLTGVVPVYTLIGSDLDALAISPNLTCFAVADSSLNNVYTFNNDCPPTIPTKEIQIGEPANSLAFSPDGTCFAVTTFDQFYLYNVTGCSIPQTPTQTFLTSGTTGQAALYSTNSCSILAINQGTTDKTSEKGKNKKAVAARQKALREARIQGALAIKNNKVSQAPAVILIYQVVTAVPHLTITKECSKKVCKKECITYEITVTNTGTGASAAGAVVTDVLPHCVSFVETDASQYTIHDQTFTATLPAIAAGASVVITITAKGHAHHKKEVTNTASLTYQGQTTESNECTTCIRR